MWCGKGDSLSHLTLHTSHLRKKALGTISPRGLKPERIEINILTLWIGDVYNKSKRTH